MTNTDRAWKAFAADDPYHGVLTKDRYRKDQFDDQARSSFLESGEQYVDHVLAVVRNHVDPDFTPKRALDFGCGVGRVTLPLAKICDEAVGLDVAEGMLSEATVNAERAGLSNVTWHLNDDDLTTLTGSFDLVHSFIVLQHLRPSRGLAIIDKLISRLQPDGVGILHMTYANGSATPLLRRIMTAAYERMPLVYAVRNLARRQPIRTGTMLMSRYNLNLVMRLLQERGCHDVHIRFSEASHYGHPLYGVIIVFRNRALTTTEFS